MATLSARSPPRGVSHPFTVLAVSSGEQRVIMSAVFPRESPPGLPSLPPHPVASVSA
jgi:hypothetical protein